MDDALAVPLERVEFESASQPLNPGDRIQGYLAKPELLPGVMSFCWSIALPRAA
jgi:hypothetical protein